MGAHFEMHVYLSRTGIKFSVARVWGRTPAVEMVRHGCTGVRGDKLGLVGWWVRGMGEGRLGSAEAADAEKRASAFIGTIIGYVKCIASRKF